MDSKAKGWRSLIQGRFAVNIKVVPLRPILITREKAKIRAKRSGKKKVTIKLNDRLNDKGLFRIRDWQDKEVQRWLKLMVLPMTYEMWAFPFRLALGVPSTSNLLWSVDLTCDAFFWFDIVVSSTTVIPASSDIEEPITEFRGIVKYFMLHKFPLELAPSFAYLVITPICASLLPSSCSSGFLLSSSHVTTADAEEQMRACLNDWTIWIWWLSTIFRVAPRTRRLSKYFQAMETDLNVSINMLQMFKYSMIILMTTHWVGCIYFFIARFQSFNESTWISRLETILPNYRSHTAPVATQYVLCMYRGLAAMTVAYSSVMLNNVWEILFTFIVIMVQVWQVGVILGAIINYTVERDPVAEAHKKLMEDLQLFIESKELPSELTERIYKHFEFQHRKAVENQSSHIDLPKSLELKVANSKFRSVLDRSSARGQVFFQCNPQFLKMLMTKLRIVFMMPNESVFKKGDMARELFFVYRGACAIMNDEKVKRVVRHDSPDSPAILGEIPFFFGVLHGLHCRADADGEVQLLVLSKADGEELFTSYPEQMELIRANILFAMGLDNTGNQLVKGAESDADPDDVAISEAVCEALKSNADETFTALTYAARVGDIEEMSKLIRKGANVNHVDYDGRGALAMAAVEGNFKVVELLLQSGVDRNCQNRWGQTPLQEAIGARQGPVVELLLQWRARINSEQNSGALCSASSTGDLEQLKRLVENKADVNIGDYDSRLPLHLAAAEGHDKIAEYLLEQKADPSAKDRWGCTPLQEAVRCGRSLLAELIRTKGGLLPADVGAVQMCTAASKGDVSQIRLLHLCGVKSDVGDYDFRCPLHLAAAEAKVLAVSFLLVISANPNSTDRWGNTPLDDALRGGTLYHKYCARLLMAWGGNLGMNMRKTKFGIDFVKEVEQISMEEVRRLIRRLIDAGYDRRIPTSQSAQEVHTYYESSVNCVQVAQSMKQVLSEGSMYLKERSTSFREILDKALEALIPVCGAIDGHPVNQRRKSMQDSEPNIRSSESFFDELSASGASLEGELRALIARKEDTSVRIEDAEENGQALDSDEEDQLHAELDRLVEMQERVEAMGGNQNKYMASVFQRVCLQITDIESMFSDMSDVFRFVSSTRDIHTIPAVTLQDFSVAVDSLKLSYMSQSILEEMFEQGLKYVPSRELVKADQADDGDRHSDALVDKDEEDVDEAPDDDVRVSMTNILIGSETFRQKLMSLDIDESYCLLADVTSLRDLSTEMLKVLSQFGKVREVGKGDSVATDSIRQKSKYSSSPSARSVRSKSKGDEDAADVHGSWYLVITGNLSVEDDPLHVVPKQFSELGPGNVFGGYQTLSDTSTPFAIRATRGCEVLELPLSNLVKFRREFPDKTQYLSSLMGESPQSAAFIAGSTDNQAKPIASVSELLQQGPLPDTRLQFIKSSFAKIEHVWKEICFEENAVPLSQFAAFQPYLGEVGSELFKKLFEGQDIPEQITNRIYWEIWINFLTQEAFGKRAADDESNKTRLQLEAQHEEEAALLKQDAYDPNLKKFGVLENLHARFAYSRRLKDKLFEEPVLERYESSFVAITGDVGVPLLKTRIDVFLERLFPDFEYQISQYNCQEFLQIFGRDGVRSKQVSYSDIRKVLMERSKNTKLDGPFVNNAFNPDGLWYLRWLAFVRLVALYHYIMVPVRLAFSPWKSMLDVRVLASDGPADVLILVHLAVLANTAYRNSRAQWVTSRGKLFRRIYPAYFLAALPCDWFAFLFNGSIEECDWLRMIKLLLPYQMLIREGVPGSRRSVALRIAKLVAFFIALIHVAACAWFYIGSRSKTWQAGQPSVSWLEADASLQNSTYIAYQNRYGIMSGSTVWDQYLVSVYWVTATVTAYGIVGDLLPQNNTEIIFTMVLMVLSITVYGFLIGEVSTVFMMQDEKITKVRAQLGSVESFVRGSGLDADLRHEIKQHLKATRARNSVDQTSIMKQMSRSLQVEVSSYTTRGYLDGVPLFAGCSPQLIDAISVLLTEVTFGPEDYLYRAGEVAREMFFVIAGSVDDVVETDKGEKVDSTVKAGGNIGVLSFFFGMRHLSSARAGKLAGATCLRLARDEFLGMLKLYPEDEGKIAQSAMTSFETARSQHGSRKANSQYAASVRSGRSSQANSVAPSSTVASGPAKDGSSLGGASDDSSAFNQAVGGSGLRQRMATLKRRRENKRVFGILMAAAKGDLVRLRASFHGEGDCNLTDHFKRTPLHVAASQGQLEAARFLIEAKGDPDARDRFDNTPLHDAVRHKHDAVAELIRQSYPGVMLMLKGHEVGGLMCQAAFEGDVGHVKRLIDNKASPSACDYDRRSALHLAACEGHLEMAKLLLEAKADPHAKDRFGGGPLDDAVRHGHEPLQQLLRSWGARLTGDQYAVKACEAAARGDLATIKTLVENGVDTAMGDYDGRTALHLAASEGEVSILDYLLKKEPPMDVNPVDRLGGTPLEDAYRHGHRVAIIMLEDVEGLRRGEKLFSSIVSRFLSLVQSHRMDLLVRARRCNIDLKMRFSRRQAAVDICQASPEASACGTIRGGVLPAIRGNVDRLHENLAGLCASIQESAPVLMRALKMQGVTIAMDEGTDMAGKNPMAASTQILAMIPDLLASIGPARDVIDAPLPMGCRLVQLLGLEFRREAASLRGEARRIALAARLLKRILKTAQTIFKTRTFRTIFRKSIMTTLLVRNFSNGGGGGGPGHGNLSFMTRLFAGARAASVDVVDTSKASSPVPLFGPKYRGFPSGSASASPLQMGSPLAHGASPFLPGRPPPRSPFLGAGGGEEFGEGSPSGCLSPGGSDDTRPHSPLGSPPASAPTAPEPARPPPTSEPAPIATVAATRAGGGASRQPAEAAVVSLAPPSAAAAVGGAAGGGDKTGGGGPASQAPPAEPSSVSPASAAVMVAAVAASAGGGSPSSSTVGIDSAGGSRRRVDGGGWGRGRGGLTIMTRGGGVTARRGGGRVARGDLAAA